MAVGPLLSSPGSLTRWPADSDMRGNPRPPEPRELGLQQPFRNGRPLWWLWARPCVQVSLTVGLSLPFSSRFS